MTRLQATCLILAGGLCHAQAFSSLSRQRITTERQYTGRPSSPRPASPLAQPLSASFVSEDVAVSRRLRFELWPRTSDASARIHLKNNKRVISPFSSLSGSATAISLQDATDSSFASSTSSYSTITDTKSDSEAEAIYKKGLATIAFITFLFASNSPTLHAAYTEVTLPPPVFLLNVACSAVAMAGMLLTGPFLDRAVDRPSLLRSGSDEGNGADGTVLPPKSTHHNNPLAFIVGEDNLTVQAGMELGLWKFLGCLANMYGLSQTSADHGSFLIQLTTLFVPLAQGFMGVPIPRRIWAAIGLALAGVALFTQDTGGADATAMSTQGDAACVAAAVMYATYDLRLFHWGKLVEPLQMITAKIVTQTTLSMVALAVFAAVPSVEYLQTASAHDLQLVAGVALWSGLAVNALAPFLQVGGQQAVGPARAQILYASQPLWASGMSFFLLGETVGSIGLLGGAAFLAAMMMAATAELPDPNCEQKMCET